jgi:O-methyltransferase
LFLQLLKETLTASIYEESSWKVIEPKPRDAPSGLSLIQSLKIYARRLVIGQLRRRSLLLVRRNKFNKEARLDGNDWPCFGFTMIGHRRLDNIEMCFRDIIEKDVPGDLIETGAWRGGATIFMRALLKAYGVEDRLVWVADSFQGLPAPKDAADGWDFSHVEEIKVSLDQVKSNFSQFGLLDDQVRFLPGWFKDTLPSAPIQKLALLRLDGDLYSSTMDVLSNLYFKVSPGGYVIIDDYYDWEPCRRAVHDFLRENKLQPTIEKIDSRGVYWKVGELNISKAC